MAGCLSPTFAAGTVQLQSPGCHQGSSSRRLRTPARRARNEAGAWPVTPSSTPSPACTLKVGDAELIGVRKRKRLKTELWSPARAVADVKGLPVFSHDVICCLYSFLDFEDMCAMKGFGKRWETSCSKKLFEREIQRRWPHDHRDIGMGAGVSPLNCLEYSDWRARTVYRERLEKIVTPKHSGECADLLLLETLCVQRKHNVAFQTEACRWVCEYFDRHCSKDQGSAMFLVPAMSNDFLNLLTQHLGNSNVKIEDQQMFAKTIGVLALHERNRGALADVRALARIVTLLRTSREEQAGLETHLNIVGCCLWALVILCRPLGGVEGEALSSFDQENFRNVKQLNDIGGVTAVLQLIKMYPKNPDMLAKAFWLLVNLALVEDVKMLLIDRCVVKDIILNMKRYPMHKRLNFRACFALINIGIRPQAKEQIRSLGGIDVLLNVMRRWPNDMKIQRCCCNVIRSLMVGDVRTTAELIDRAGGTKLVEGILERFTDAEWNSAHTSLRTMATRLLHFLRSYRDL